MLNTTAGALSQKLNADFPNMVVMKMLDHSKGCLKKVYISVSLGTIMGFIVPLLTTIFVMFCESKLFFILFSIIMNITVAAILKNRLLISFVYRICSFFLVSFCFSFFIYTNNIYSSIYTFFNPEVELNAGFGFGAFLIIPFSLMNTTISIVFSIILLFFMKLIIGSFYKHNNSNV